MKLVKADYTNYQMHWVEWDKQAMTAGAFLPDTESSPAFIGNYVVTKPYPNPLKSVQTGTAPWTVNPISSNLESGGDPSVAIPGDIGNIVYYPFQEGPFMTSSTATMSFAILENNYN